MSYTWHLHGIHKALTCNTHVMPMAYTWPWVHMALTWNAHKTHVEYPWNALCIHREYTWHVIHMVCTWDTTTMIHIAYLCTWHTQKHCMHGMHMVCTSCVHSVRLHYTWHHMAMAYIACFACWHHMSSHVIYSINLSAYPKDSSLLVLPFGHVHVERIVGGSSFGHDLRNWRRWRLPRPW